MADDSMNAPPKASNLPEFTVSEISAAVKRTVEGNFERVRVRGEISRPSFPGSGHVYFRLKDENAVLDAVCWRSVAPRLSVRPEDGLEVIATGRLTTYAGKSSYQIVVESLEMAGEGALLKLLEERRKKLAAEGLFDEARKRPLPYLPSVIGVVTSPTGAVIRDILHRLAERFPRHVLVWPVAVQGEQAAPQVAAAIEGFNSLAPGGPVPRPDVLIVARGGGSLEDLWAFNEEIVVRAAAASEIPLISAVGHETDTTLIDFASDRRAPTPTAAAEIAVPVRGEILTQVLDFARRLSGAAARQLEHQRERLEGLARGLPKPQRLVEEKGQRLDDYASRMDAAMRSGLRDRRARVETLAAQIPHPRQQIGFAERSLGDLENRLGRAVRRIESDVRTSLQSLGRLLDGFSYHKTLARGFAVVRSGGAVMTRAAQIDTGRDLDIEFADGSVSARAAGKAVPRAGRAAGGKTGGSKSSGGKDDPQGTLL